MKRLVYLLAFLSVAVHAADLKLQPYPNAREVFHTASQDDNFLLALSSYKKVDSSWLVDRSQRLSGSLERTTFELPADHTAEAGFFNLPGVHVVYLDNTLSNHLNSGGNFDGSYAGSRRSPPHAAFA